MKTLVCGLSMLLFVGQATAITLTDRWPDDLNSIRFSTQDNGNQILMWEELYREDNLIPYPSPDGRAVVNAPGEPGCPAGTDPCYFDKIFALEGESGIWEFQIGVFNDSPFDWSDYHFEFYDAAFQTPLDNVLLDARNGIFPIVDLMPNAVWFSGETQLSGPDFLQNAVTLTVDLDGIGPDGSFGIRQVATTPEPTTLALIGIGLAGLGFVRRRRLTA